MDLAVIQPAAGTREPYAMEAPALTTTDEQLVVGDIPAPPPGLQPRPALLAQLNRASQKPPVVLTGIWGAEPSRTAAIR